MADNAVTILEPPAPPQSPPFNTEKEALFDSIIKEKIDGNGSSQSTPTKTFFTGLLWFGYSIAIVVALVLVWSAAGALLKSLPR